MSALIESETDHDLVSSSKRDREFIVDRQPIAKRSRSEVGSAAAVRLRGLPRAVGKQDVLDFLRDCEVDINDVVLLRNVSGEAYVRLRNVEDQDKALKRDREHLGKRYIEVFRSSLQEFHRELNVMRSVEPPDADYNGVIKMRGLPFRATKQDVIEFFPEMNVGKDKVCLGLTPSGKPSGTAYVEFDSAEEAQRALSHDKETMGGRWIDLFQCTKGEMYNVMNAFGGRSDSRGSGDHDGDRPFAYPPSTDVTRNVVHLRGLPYDATRKDIIGFLEMERLAESKVFLLYKQNGRPSGEAMVLMDNEEDVQGALHKDKEKMGDRWIDMFQLPTQALHDRIGAAVKFASKPDANELVALRLRGLPFSVDVDSIRSFFMAFEVEDHGVYIINNPLGRPTGDAFVVFTSEEAAAKAMVKDKENIGGRYIELSPATMADVYVATVYCKSHFVGGRQVLDSKGMTCARLRGLPFKVVEEDIFQFFTGIKVIGIFICRNPSGEGTGEGFVEFESIFEAQRAMSRNRETMGDRYVEVFACSKEEVLSRIRGY